MPIILSLQSQRKEDQEFRASLGYIKPCLNNTTTKIEVWLVPCPSSRKVCPWHLVRAFVLLHNMMKGECVHTIRKAQPSWPNLYLTVLNAIMMGLNLRFNLRALFFETESHYIALTGLELSMHTRLAWIILSLPPQFWDYRHIPPCLALYEFWRAFCPPFLPSVSSLHQSD